MVQNIVRLDEGEAEESEVTHKASEKWKCRLATLSTAHVAVV